MSDDTLFVDAGRIQIFSLKPARQTMLSYAEHWRVEVDDADLERAWMLIAEALVAHLRENGITSARMREERPLQRKEEKP